MAGDGYACWGGCKTVQVSLHMVEAVRGDGFILLQSNSPFASRRAVCGKAARTTSRRSGGAPISSHSSRRR